MTKIEQLLNQQRVHDSNYHLDIYQLPVIYKIKHFSFHYTKYLCKIIMFKDREELKRYLLDTFIISLSFANTLNINLENIDFKVRLDQFVEFYAKTGIIEKYSEILLKLTKALDAYDHIEDFSIRSELQVIPQGFINIVLDMIFILKWDTFETELLLRYQEIRDKRLK